MGKQKNKNDELKSILDDVLSGKDTDPKKKKPQPKQDVLKSILDEVVGKDTSEPTSEKDQYFDQGVMPFGQTTPEENPNQPSDIALAAEQEAESPTTTLEDSLQQKMGVDPFKIKSNVIDNSIDNLSEAAEQEADDMDELIEALDVQPSDNVSPADLKKAEIIEGYAKDIGEQLQAGDITEEEAQQSLGIALREMSVNGAPETNKQKMKRIRTTALEETPEGANTNVVELGRDNQDGSVSSVVMTSMDNTAFPTIFPKDPNSTSRDPKDWIELPPEEARAEAIKRGEVFYFDTPEEANEFARGSWKEGKDLSFDKSGVVAQDVTKIEPLKKLLTPQQIARANQRKANNEVYADVAKSLLENLPEFEIKDKWDIKLSETKEYQAQAIARNKTEKILKNIIRMSEDKGKFKDFMAGVGMAEEKLLPFIGAVSEMNEYDLIGKIQKKPEEERTQVEKDYMKGLALLNSFHAEGIISNWMGYGEAFALMIPYAAEFAGTGFAFKAGKGLITAGARQLMGKTVTVGTNKVATFLTSNFTGALAQATANPQRYMAETKRRMNDHMLAIVDTDINEIDKVIVGSKGEDFNTAFKKAYPSNVSEFITERLGLAILRGRQKIAKGIVNTQQKAAKTKLFKEIASEENFKRYTLGLFAKKKGLTSWAETQKVAEKMQWHGVITEVWGEEYPNMIINAAITGDQDIWEAMSPFSEELNKMWIPAMIFQGAMYAPQGAVKATEYSMLLAGEYQRWKEDKAFQEKPDFPEVPPKPEEPVEPKPEEGEVTIKKTNPLSQKLYEKLTKLAEEGDEDAAAFADEFDTFGEEVTEEWIEEADKLITDKEKTAEEESTPTQSTEAKGPVKDREQGFKVKDGVKYERPEPVKKVEGKTSRVRFGANKVEETKIAVIEADDLQPSHIQGNVNNKHFIPEAQPKNRSSIQGEASQINSQKIAEFLEPEEITNEGDAYSGPPVVNERGEIIQGNNRGDALKYYYKNFKGDPRGYKQYIQDNAEKFGLNPDELSGIENPVLVRVSQADDNAAIELGQFSKADTESGGKRGIEPKQVARKMGEGAKVNLMNILAKSNAESLTEIIRENEGTILSGLKNFKLINETQAETLVKDGKLTPDGVKQIGDIFKQLLFDGGPAELTEEFEGLPHIAKKGLEKALPNILRSKQSLNTEIQNAIIGFNEFSRSNIDTVDNWMNQSDAFSGGQAPLQKYSPVEQEMIKLFANAKRQKDITDKFDQFYSLTDGRDADMFNEAEEGKSRADAIKEVFGVEDNPSVEAVQGQEELGGLQLKPLGKDSYEVLTKGNKSVGYITDVRIKEGYVGLSPEVDQGYGQKTYIAVAKMFPDKNVLSSADLSPLAQAMWERFFEKGYAERSEVGKYDNGEPIFVYKLDKYPDLTLKINKALEGKETEKEVEKKEKVTILEEEQTVPPKEETTPTEPTEQTEGSEKVKDPLFISDEKPTKSQELDEKEAKLKAKMADLLNRFGKGGAATSGGVTPQDIAIAGEIIAAAAEAGYYKFQRIVLYIEENFPGWLEDNYKALRGAYATNVMMDENSEESLDKIKKLSKDEAITQGTDIKRNEGRSTEPTQATEEGEETGQVPTEESGQGERTGDGATYTGTTPESDTGVDDGGSTLIPTGRTDEGEGVVEEESDSGNYVIPSDYEAPTTFNVKRNLRNNIEALRVLRDIKNDAIIDENTGVIIERPATKEEQEILFNYVGWGAIKEIAFDPRYGYKWDTPASKELRPSIQVVYDLVKEIYGEKEFDIIAGFKASILNAHYTQIPAIKGIYKTLENWGVKGNLKILEPSAGTGHFVGAMPQSMRNGANITTVELEKVTSDILNLLYPKGNNYNAGLQETNLPINYYDVVVSNIPFGDYRVSDPLYQKASTQKKKAQGKIHNYFFSKGLDLVRPGGIVAFITSSGVLDSESNKFIREMMAEEAEFLGAVKLPSSTFKANAGTEVTTDLIFLRKYNEGETPKGTQDFINTSTITRQQDQYGRVSKYSLNDYWKKNPDRMIGEISKEGGGMYGIDGYKLEGSASNIENDIPDIMGKEVSYQKTSSKASDKLAFIEAYQGDLYTREGNLVVHNGKIGVYDAGRFVPLSLKVEDQTLLEYISIRTALNEIILKEVQGESDKVLDPIRKRLNETYDSFVEKHGRIGKASNWKWIVEDIDAFNIVGLEVYNKETKEFERKADIFNKRTISPNTRVELESDPRSAVLISINETGAVDIARVASLLQVDEDKARKRLKGVIYELPSGGYEIIDRYLSGNVREKLAQAEAAAKIDERFEANVEALKEVVPKDIPINLISTNMGARWIDIKYYKEFLRDEFDIYSDIEITLGGKTNTRSEGYNDQFKVSIPYDASVKFDYLRTGKQSAVNILTHALNDKYPKISKRDPKDKDKTVIDEVATTAVRLQINKLKDNFTNYINGNEQHGIELARKYNDMFNTSIKGKVDGSYLTVPGYAGPPLRPHQKDAVALLLQNKGGIVDHIVGAGKSLVMIVAALEMRRLGIAKKPVIYAKKNTIPHMTAEAQGSFPAAKILSIGENDFDKSGREALLAKIANNDWDLIIMSHDNMKAIPPPPEMVKEVLREEISKLELDIEWMQGENTTFSKQQAKALEKRKLALEAKIKEASTKKKDQSRSFDQLGIDHIFADESHTFKNLQYTTRHGDVSGLSATKGSDFANFLMFNIRHLQKINKGDKGATFLSGTMVTNTIVEMYSILNFLRPNKLRELEISNFDAWASTFAEQVSEFEFSVEGTPKQITRFSKFKNLQELSMLYSEIADVRNDHNLTLPKPTINKQLVTIPHSTAFARFTKRIIHFAKTGQFDVLGFGPGTEGQSKAKMLVALNFAQQAAIDLRMLFKDAPEQRESKLAVATDKIYNIYQETNEYRGTQLVFLDQQNASKSADPSNKFNAHKAIRDKLIAYGIPKEEIVILGDVSKNKKEGVFEEMRHGRVRIMIGHKTTMGTGVNVQDRGVALHHIDLYWNPAPHTQADGRFVRQGNWVAEKYRNNVVDSYYYGTEKSLDIVKFDKQKTKALFIEQLTEGSVTDREVEEESENSEDLGSFLATLTGNNAIMEVGKTEQKIKALTFEKRAFVQRQNNAKLNLSETELSLNNNIELKPQYEQDKKALEDRGKFNEDGNLVYNITIGKEKYTKGKEVGKKIWTRMQELYPNIRDGEQVEIGNVYGFPIIIESQWVTDRLFWKVQGDSGVHYRWGDGYGFIAGDISTEEIFTTLGRFPIEAVKRIDVGLAKIEDNITKKTKDIADYKKLLEAKWEKDEEKRILEAKVATLKEELSKYDIDKGLGGLQVDLFEEDESDLVLAATGSVKKDIVSKGKNSKSISGYTERKVTPEQKKQLAEETKLPWKIMQKLLDLATKWAPDSPIGQGGLARGSIGTYFGKGKHIRVQGMNSFDVFIHELLHAIDDKLDVSKKFIAATYHGHEIRKKLTDLYEEFYPTGKRSHSLKKRVMEGLAVLVQQMAQNEAKTMAKYGDLVKLFFTEGGEYAFEGAQEFAEDIERLIVEYQNLPDLEKIGAHIVQEGEQPGRKRKKIVSAGVLGAEELFDHLAFLEDIAKKNGTFKTDRDLPQFIRYVNNALNWAKQNIDGEKNEYWAFNDQGEMVKKYDFNYRTIKQSLIKRRLLPDFGHWLKARRIHGDYMDLKRLGEEKVELEEKIEVLENQLETEELTAVQEAKMIERLGTLNGELNWVNSEIDRITMIVDNEGINEIDATAAYLEGEGMFKEEAGMIDKLMWEDVLLLRRANLVSNDFVSRAAGKYGVYAPFRKIQYDEATGLGVRVDMGMLNKLFGEDDLPVIKSGGRTKVASTMYRGGSAKPTLDPFSGAQKNHVDIMNKSTKQMVYNMLIDLSDVMPEWFKPGVRYSKELENNPDIIIARKSDGTRVALAPHKKIKQVIDENFTVQNIGAVTSMLITMSQWFRTGTTGVYPLFAVSNFAMDQISAYVNSTEKFKPVFTPLFTAMAPMTQTWYNNNIAKPIDKRFGTAMAMQDSEEARLFQEYVFLAGNSQTFLRAHELGETGTFESKSVEALKEFRESKLGKRIIIPQLTVSIVNAMAIPGLTAEVLTRAAEYINARMAVDKNGNKKYSQFVALELAGRVSTPFHHMGRLRIGSKESSRPIVRMVPYFNAALQVLHQQVRTWQESTEGRKRIVYAMGSILAVQAAALLRMLDDDDKKDMLEIMKAQDPKTLTQNLFFPTPWGLARVRMPENYAWMGALFNMALLENKGEAVYRGSEYFDVATAWIPQQLNFIEWDSWFMSLLPPPIKVLTEQAGNFKMYPRKQAIVNIWEEDKRFNEYSSEIANILGEQLDIHPKKIDHLITGLFGRAAKYGLSPFQSIDAITGGGLRAKEKFNKMTAKHLDMPAMPTQGSASLTLKGTFLREMYLNSSRQVQSYYNIDKQVKSDWKRLNNGTKKFTKEEEKKLKEMMEILSGKAYKVSVVKKGEYRGQKRYNRKKSGIDDLLKKYRNVDIEQEPARAFKLRADIFNKIRKVEQIYYKE